MDGVAFLRQRIFLIERDDAQFARPFVGAARELGRLQQAALFALAIFRGQPRAALDGKVTGYEVAFPCMCCGREDGGGSHAAQRYEHSILQLTAKIRSWVRAVGGGEASVHCIVFWRAGDTLFERSTEARHRQHQPRILEIFDHATRLRD